MVVGCDDNVVNPTSSQTNMPCNIEGQVCVNGAYVNSTGECVCY